MSAGAPSAAAAGPIRVVGMGADGPSGLSARAHALVAQAEVLAGGRRHLAWFADHRAERLTLGGGLAALERLGERWRAGRRAVVLASGDPGFFGIASRLRARFGAAAVEVLPAVSSVQLAYARAGLSWERARFLSAHGRSLAALVQGVAVSAAPSFGLLTDRDSTPARIAAALLAAGLPDARAVVGERLGAPDERVVETTLACLATQPADALDPLCLLVVDRGGDRRPAAWPPGAEAARSIHDVRATARHPGREAAVPAMAGSAPHVAAPDRPVPRPAPVCGRPESEFAHASGMVTKAEARAVGLARLRPARRDVVWDIGAGCGSVAVEAASLAHEGRVYAVERDAAQRAYIEVNARRFDAGNLEVVAGEAPDCLAALPDPGAVFIGGSGGRQAAILACVGRRLRPGGRLVAHFATLQGLAGFCAWAEVAGWPVEVVQLGVSRSRALGGGDVGGPSPRLRFAALDPVWIALAVPPA